MTEILYYYLHVVHRLTISSSKQTQLHHPIVMGDAPHATRLLIKKSHNKDVKEKVKENS